MNLTLNDKLHAAQIEAVEKLKRLRVGALYMDRQEGKMRTVAELVRFRFGKGKIGSVMWLCTRRRTELIQTGIARYLPEIGEKIHVVGMETLSHSLKAFSEALKSVKSVQTMLVIDNGLLIKNVKAIRTMRVFELAGLCPYRLLIGDMPFTKNIADVFAQWYVLDKRILGYDSFYGFSVNHVGKRGEPKNADYISRSIEPFCAQIMRRDVQPTGNKREYVYYFELPEGSMREYKRVADRFMRQAIFSNTGVYRMLQACQQVITGQRVIKEYPLKTESLYKTDGEDPRLSAFLEVVGKYRDKKILVLFKYKHEERKILKALTGKYGKNAAGVYSGRMKRVPDVLLMNVIADENEKIRLRVNVIIHYSNDWNWQKREEKERQGLNFNSDGVLEVISLAARDTLDIRILRSVWNKENLLESMRNELRCSLKCGVSKNAESIQR